MRNAKYGRAFLALAVGGSSASVVWGAQWTSVAESGMAVPGTGGVPAVFASFLPPRVNRGGEIAFGSFIQGTGIVAPRNKIVVWASGGTLTRVARSSDPFPGSQGGIYHSLAPYEFGINEIGEIAFSGSENSEQFRSLLFGDHEDVRSVFRSSGPSTVLPGVDYLQFWSPSLVIPGEVTFVGWGARSTPIGGAAYTLFRSSATGPVVLADQFQQVPGSAPGIVYRSLSIAFSQNANDVITFRGSMGGAGSFDPTQQAVFYGKPGSISARILGTLPAPHTDAGITYGTLGGMAVLDAAGNLMHNVTLDGPGVDTDNDGALYLQPADRSEATLVAREGNHVPGTDSRYGTLGGIVFAMNGAVVLSSTLVGGSAGPSDKAILLGDPGNLSTVVRTGDRLPGSGADVFIQDFVLRNAPSDSRTIIFTATLTGEGVTAENDSALLSYRPGDGVDVLIREGEPLDANNSRLVQGFGDAVLSPTDIVVMTVMFRDGSSAIVTSVVPEPTALSAIGVAAGLVLSRRRR